MRLVLTAPQANGGEVVLLEKQADILIADHKRRDAPPGSYSWRFVEDSVKNGAVMQMQEYLNNPPPAARPVGSGQPTKATRTPYSKADDEILMRWVLTRERAGQSTQGNVIYQELAIKVRHFGRVFRVSLP